MSCDDCKILSKAMTDFGNQLDMLVGSFLSEYEKNGLQEQTLAFLLIHEARIQLSFLVPDYHECLGILTHMLNDDFENTHKEITDLMYDNIEEKKEEENE